MRERWNLPIGYDDKRHGYYFTEKVDRLPWVPVTEAELFAVCISQKVLELYHGMPFQKPLELAFAKITRSLDDEERYMLENLDLAFSFRPFAPEDPDLRVLELLTRAVAERRGLRFSYRKPGAKRSEVRKVHPYHVMEYEGRLYLLAHDPARGAVRKFVLGRMSKPALTGERFNRPKDFDPAKQYPMLCVIHGGPTGVDAPQMVHAGYYPIDIWTARGALVLRVNYRGSAGYGEKFRQLNVRNLGVGDAWDVESGVDFLIAKGWVDPKRVGVMGWSQGGYISAFLTTSSTKFAAASVGAGISNWATYYYNTDITPFTIQYLGADPAADPEIYRKTSPMSYIKQARTPTLIQHGELDRRVPIPNGYELRQGLEDRGVPVEMVVYKGFGHGINKPKAMRAVLQHNLDWFGHYLWGDPKPDFANPKVPKAKEEKKDGS